MSLIKAIFGGKKSLEEYRKERQAAKSAINSVDGIIKPTQRRIALRKNGGSRFGADLCKISGRVFVLKIDESRVEDTYGEFLPAMRAGLSRFDELIQLEERDISQHTLSDVYRYLQESEKVNITVADRPLTRTFTINDLASSQLLRESLTATGFNNDLIYCSSSMAPVSEGEAIVEVNGELVLGMTMEELNFIFDYAQDKNEGVYTVATLPVDVAGAFLSAYVETTAVFGSKDWKCGDLLRRSQRHSKRRNSFTGSLRRKSMSSFSTTSLRKQSATNLDEDTLARARALIAG